MGERGGPAFSIESRAGLAETTLRTLLGLHEAGHIVADLACGIHVHAARLEQADGEVVAGPINDEDTLLACLAAGERATERWLHEQGMWTPARALLVEYHSGDDQAEATRRLAHVGFGTGKRDYADAYALADTVLNEHWHRVLAVASRLQAGGELTGDQCAAAAGLPNPPAAGPRQFGGHARDLSLRLRRTHPA